MVLWKGVVINQGAGESTFWHVGNVLNLDLAGDSMGVYIHESPSNCFPKMGCPSNTLSCIPVLELNHFF